MPGLDPHNARAVLGGLTRRLDRALAARDPRWSCPRVLPRPDGTAVLSLRLGPREESLLWGAPEAGSSRPWAAWGGLEGVGVEVAARKVVAQTLSRAVSHPAYALLAYVNRDLRVLRWGDSVVDTLLAGRCAPGHTRWFGWMLAEVFQGAADRFELHFDGSPGRLTLAVTAPGVTLDGAALVVGTSSYKLWLVVDPRPQGARQRVSEQVERLVAFLLARAVPSGLIVEGAQVVSFDVGASGSAGQTNPYGRGAPVSTTRWGNPHQWHQFFSDFEVARAGLCGMVFTEPQAFVTHGEPECHRVEPIVWPRHHVFARIPFEHRSVKDEPESRGFAVVVTERDLVFGGMEPLGRALDAALAHTEARFVVLNNTCLPKMAGDDVASLVASRCAAGGKPVISMNTDLDSPEATYQDIVRQTVAQDDQRPMVEVGSGIGLLGFTPGRARDELAMLCKALGLPVVGCLGPELSQRRAAAFRQAALHVVYPAPPWPSLRDQLFGEHGAPAIRPPAPFGLAGTEAWITAVAAAVEGGGNGIRDRFLAETEPLARRFAALRAGVEGTGLALVVEMSEADRLFDSARCYGVRLLPLLGECGFDLHVLLREVPEREGEPLDDTVIARLQEARFPGSTLGAHRFTTEEDLHDLLGGDHLRMVYSEVACDERLARHGLVGFGLDLWELGPEGAVRSLERLARLAKWRFFERYCRRSRASAGAGAPPTCP